MNEDYYDALPNSKLLSIKEAAEFLDVTPSALQAWRTCGRYDLPYIKVGRKVRYRLEELRLFLENRKRLHT